MKKHYLTFVTLFLFPSTLLWAFDHYHSNFTLLLKQAHVWVGKSAVIDYRAIVDNPRYLEAYLKEIASVAHHDYYTFSTHEKIAFLINAYNAFTIKLIVDNYYTGSNKKKTLKSIKGIFIFSPWEKELFSLFGKKVHLNYIEHDLLRKKFNEPRIHFALVCASRSCPPIQDKAFTGDNLDDQLDKAAQNFLGDTNNNRFDRVRMVLKLSQIFDWYGDDFTKKYGSVKKYVARFLASDKKEEKFIPGDKVKIEYVDYDWSLNDRRLFN